MYKKLVLVLTVILALLLASCAPAAPAEQPAPAAPAQEEAPAAEAPAEEAPAAEAPAEEAPATEAPAAEEEAPAAEAPAAEEEAAQEETAAEATGEEVSLVMGSWRVDDVEQMNRILAAFNEQHPNIQISFDPTNPPEYNAVLRTQLEGGTAPDLFYLRSFSTSRQLFEEGFLESLEGLPGLEENFSEAAMGAWSTEDGETYGVPFIAVSHGIYYNQDLFEELGLSVPTTWDELMQTAQVTFPLPMPPGTSGP